VWPNPSLCGQIRDVRALSKSVSLRELDLSYATADNAGIATADNAGMEGLKRIPTLTPLHFLRLQMQRQHDKDLPRSVVALCWTCCSRM
jgi:hypothetical protein